LLICDLIFLHVNDGAVEVESGGVVMNMNEEMQIEKESREVFSRLAGIELQTPPYMKTRVLAHVRERLSGAQSAWFWKAIALGTSAMSLGLLFYVGSINSGNSGKLPGLNPLASVATFVTGINEAVEIALDTKDLAKADVARAEIILPEGVKFYAPNMPEFEKLRKFEFAWANLVDKSFMPIGVSGMETGEKAVKVRFYNSKNTLIAEREVKIQVVNKVATRISASGGVS